MLIIEDTIIGGRNLKRLYSDNELKQILDKTSGIIQNEVIARSIDIDNYEEVDIPDEVV